MGVAQRYLCPNCRYSFGPVGTLPVTAQDMQFLVVCRSCRQAAAITAPAGPLTVPCRCGAQAWDALGPCPACGSPEAGWHLV